MHLYGSMVKKCRYAVVETDAEEKEVTRRNGKEFFSMTLYGYLWPCGEKNAVTRQLKRARKKR